MATEAVIIPVEFDVAKGAASLSKVDAALKQLTGSANNLKGVMGGVGNAVNNALGGLARGALVGGAIGLIASHAQAFFKVSDSSKKAAAALQEYNRIKEKVISDTAQEVGKVQVLVGILNQENITRGKKISAINELKKIAPEHFGILDKEHSTIGAINKLYDIYIANQIRAVEIKVKEKQLESIIEKRLALQAELNFKLSEEVVINGKRVRVFNAVYDATGKMVGKEKELINLLAQEKLLVEQIGSGKQLKPGVIKEVEIKTPELKIEPDRIRLGRFTRPLELAVPEVVIDADEVSFKKFSDGLPGLKGKPDKLEHVSGAVALANKSIGELDARVVAAAANVSGALTPAFTGMFDAIVAGENPLKAFFNGLIQGVNQLIDRLIAAAIQAAVLSAISGGATSFGSAFTKIIGGGGIANRVGFAGGGSKVNLSGEFLMRGSTAVALVRQGNSELGRVG